MVNGSTNVKLDMKPLYSEKTLPMCRVDCVRVRWLLEIQSQNKLHGQK